MKLDRYDGIQVLRFVAAVLVVLVHAFHYAHERVDFDFVWRKGGRGVDIFFVISGFVMAISAQKLLGSPLAWRDFMSQRLIRIVPMYWLTTTIKVAVMLFASHVVLHADLDFIKIVLSYFFIPYKKASGRIEPTLGVGWTLVFEMFFYIVFCIALRLKLNIYAFVGSVMAMCALGSLARPDNVPASMFLLDSIVLEFVFGMAVANLALKRQFLSVKLAVTLAVLSMAQLAFGPGFGIPRALGAGIPAMVLVYAVISLERVIQGKIPSALMFLGATSYSMYLVHPLILPAVPLLLYKVGITNAWFSALLSVMLIIVASSLAYKFVERPIDIKLRERFLKSSKPAKQTTQFS